MSFIPPQYPNGSVESAGPFALGSSAFFPSNPINPMEEVHRLRHQEGALREKLAEQLQIIRNLNTKIQVTQGQVSASDQYLAHLSSEIEELKKALHYKTQLQHESDQILMLRNRAIEQLQGDLQRSQQENSQLTSQVQNLQGDLQRSNERNTALARQIDELERQSLAMRREITRLEVGTKQRDDIIQLFRNIEAATSRR